MKKLLLLLALTSFQVICNAQNALEILSERGEVRFSFQENNPSRIADLSRIISIDNAKDGLVEAYANEREWNLFLEYNYPYTLIQETAPKALTMASTLEEMENWDRYPTYPTYLAMMQRFADQYPSRCTIDTIGVSQGGRLILTAHITNGTNQGDNPQFFYSATMHGDELTSYYLMLRVIDVLLKDYETDEYIHRLVDSVDIFINPLSNPDGTYNGGDNTVSNSKRYNYNNVDLNRNYPDPFGTEAMDPLQSENRDMMSYCAAHKFKMSANLHGGAEVMNYPWDSYTTYQRPHPEKAWWVEVSKRFIQHCREQNPNKFTDVTTTGYIAGGDWYVIRNGRQDYMNQTLGIREMTMELSVSKKLSTSELNNYWNIEKDALLGYIAETKAFRTQGGSTQGIPTTESTHLRLFPNPCVNEVIVKSPSPQTITLLDIYGQRLLTLEGAENKVDMSKYPSGTYILIQGREILRFIKL